MTPQRDSGVSRPGSTTGRKHPPSTTQSDPYLKLPRIEHIRAHLSREGKAASRYESKHQACAPLCVSRSLCVSVTQRESSSHLCLSAAPASLTSEARNDSSALHSASLSLPHNTVPLSIIIISRPAKNTLWTLLRLPSSLSLLFQSAKNCTPPGPPE